MLKELRYGESGVYEYDREKVAIDRLKLYEPLALSISDEGYYLADSGGKDSGVIKRIAEKSGVKFFIGHSHTGLDCPETVYFVRREKKRYEEMGIRYRIEMPAMSPWALIRERLIPPLRTARYCCKVLKEGSGKGYCVITGVRWEESSNRKNSRGIAEVQRRNRKESYILTNDNEEGRKEFENCVLKGMRIVNPIIDWSEGDVWEYTRKENIPYNPLYDRGHKRVGCIGCPMANAATAEREFREWPKYKEMYIRTFQRMIDDRVKAGKTNIHKDGVEYFDWWINRERRPYKDPEQIVFGEEGEDEEEGEEWT